MEIKFRQPIFINGVFHHWHYWGFFDDGFVGPETNLSSIEDAKENSQQFTGRRDENDKDIYGGDIVKVEDTDYPCMYKNETYGDIFVVYWDEEWLAWHLRKKGLVTNFCRKKIQVIGNITENPEYGSGSWQAAG